MNRGWPEDRYSFSPDNLKIEMFWDVTPWNLVDRYQRFGGTYCLHLQGRLVDTNVLERMLAPPSGQTWRRKQQIPPKCWNLFTTPKGITSNKTIIFIFTVMRISNLTVLELWNIYIEIFICGCIRLCKETIFLSKLLLVPGSDCPLHRMFTQIEVTELQHKMHARRAHGAIFQKVIKSIHLAQDRVRWGPFWGCTGEPYSNEKKAPGISAWWLQSLTGAFYKTVFLRNNR
jgi:hypothetical protein